VQERRRFQRIEFDAQSEIKTPECSWPIKLVDISFKGVLAEIVIPPSLNPGDKADIVIRLANDIVITMPSVLRHHLGGFIGFETENIDLDSMSHLRRLVELNLGDEGLLERELDHLVHS